MALGRCWSYAKVTISEIIIPAFSRRSLLLAHLSPLPPPQPCLGTAPDSGEGALWPARTCSPATVFPNMHKKAHKPPKSSFDRTVYLMEYSPRDRFVHI